MVRNNMWSQISFYFQSDIYALKCLFIIPVSCFDNNHVLLVI